MIHLPTFTDLPVAVHAGPVILHGDLSMPDEPEGLIIFAHGNGSSRRGGRNRRIAGALRNAGFATLLMDLLTESEEAIELRTRALGSGIGLPATRVTAAVDWVCCQPTVSPLRIGLFGAGSGAAAALVAAARRPDRVHAVVSRGGQPDLAARALQSVKAPTLLIVGGADDVAIRQSRRALAELACRRELAVIPGATHSFEEPGALADVTRLASHWFCDHLSPTHSYSRILPTM